MHFVPDKSFSLWVAGDKSVCLWRQGSQLTFNELTYELTVNDKKRRLTVVHYDLLRIFMRGGRCARAGDGGRVISYGELIYLWQLLHNKTVSKDAVVQAVGRLNKEIEPGGLHIETVDGVGFKLSITGNTGAQCDVLEGPPSAGFKFKAGDVLAELGITLEEALPAHEPEVEGWVVRKGHEQQIIRFAHGLPGSLGLQAEFQYAKDIELGFDKDDPAFKNRRSPILRVIGASFERFPHHLLYECKGVPLSRLADEPRFVHLEYKRLQLAAEIAWVVETLDLIRPHGDIKPATIYVDPQWRVWLAPWVGALFTCGRYGTLKSDLSATATVVCKVVVGDLKRTLLPGWQAGIGDARIIRALEKAGNQDPRVSGELEDLIAVLNECVADSLGKTPSQGS